MLVEVGGRDTADFVAVVVCVTVSSINDEGCVLHRRVIFCVMSLFAGKVKRRKEENEKEGSVLSERSENVNGGRERSKRGESESDSTRRDKKEKDLSVRGKKESGRKGKERKERDLKGKESGRDS